MADIVKSRNIGQNCTPVYTPVYQAGIDTLWESIPTMPIVNQVKKASLNGVKSIFDLVEKATPEYEDISGTTVMMVCKIGNDLTHDIVKVIGCTNTGYVVEYNGTEYTVKRSITRFIMAPMEANMESE